MVERLHFVGPNRCVRVESTSLRKKKTCCEREPTMCFKLQKNSLGLACSLVVSVCCLLALQLLAAGTIAMPWFGDGIRSFVAVMAAFQEVFCWLLYPCSVKPHP